MDRAPPPPGDLEALPLQGLARQVGRGRQGRLSRRQLELQERVRRAVREAAEAEAELAERAEARLHDLDVNLVRLVLEFYATAEAERALRERRLGRDLRRVRSLARAARHTLDCAVLGAHLAHETGGRVRLARLPADATESQRVRRAVEGRLHGATAREHGLGAVRMVALFKICNERLAAGFHDRLRAQQQQQPCEVRGLFCAVPAAALARTACFGVGEVAPELFAETFTARWPKRPGDRQRPALAAEQAARAGGVTLPLALSEHSTVGLRRAPEPGRPHYLALCRVLVRKVQGIGVYGGRLPQTPPQGFSAVHDPARDELFVYDPGCVYPEFLIQVDYEAAAEDGAAEGPAGPAGAAHLLRGPEVAKERELAEEASIYAGSIGAELEEGAQDLARLHRTALAAAMQSRQKQVQGLKERVSAATKRLSRARTRTEHCQQQGASYARAVAQGCG